MVGDHIQFALEDGLVAEPFADITDGAGYIEIGVAEFDTGVGDRHLAVGITELDRRDIDGFGQPLRHIHLSGLEVHLESRVPLEQDVLFSGFVACSRFEREGAGLGGQFVSHAGIQRGGMEFGLQPRRRLVLASAGERCFQSRNA